MVETLRIEEKKLSQQQVTASSTVDNLEADVRRVQGAIAALMGQIDAMPRRPRKKGYNSDEVVGLIERTLEKNGRLTMPKLRQAVQSVASEEGRTKSGIEPSLEGALRAGPFRFNGAHWELKAVN